MKESTTSQPLFIPGHVPSSKNSRVRTKNGAFVASKAVQKYRKNSGIFWKIHAQTFRAACKESPVKVGFHFVRKTRHLYDWVNPLQTVQDEMTKYGWIEDDNISIILPFPLKIDGAYTTVDPSKPGVYIKIL